MLRRTLHGLFRVKALCCMWTIITAPCKWFVIVYAKCPLAELNTYGYKGTSAMAMASCPCASFSFCNRTAETQHTLGR